ncbi:MAG TPA: CRTAC1 family protein, partial [Gaiellaceae bacterium]|nr:CRTAC1 family protein [Gaiellaceae bacterium]
RRIAVDEEPVLVPSYDVRRIRLTLRPGRGQSGPTVVAALHGLLGVDEYTGSPPSLTRRGRPAPFRRTLELGAKNGRYVIVGSRGGWLPLAGPVRIPVARSFGGVRLQNVASEAGLAFRHGAFRFGSDGDETAMMGGGLCWLDYDGDGWLDLFVVNSYAEQDYARYAQRGDLPRSALFRNVRGRFHDVSRRAGAALPVRGDGCAAGDLDGDGDTDLYVTTAGFNVETNGYDALLWNDGDGTFTEGARKAGIADNGWHTGVAIGDVNGDDRQDLFVAGYTDANASIAGSTAGFPTNHRAERDRLYINQGPGPDGRPTFRDVGRRVGLEPKRAEHGLGAVFTDVDGDGRLDLYVANDGDPNQLYLNLAADNVLGFRLEERGRREAVDDANAGMGIAVGDFDVDGRPDLFVTNSRGQLHAVFRRLAGTGGPRFADARAGLAAALGASYTGWGVSWPDLDLDGNPDLVLANGAIPVTKLSEDAERLQVLQNQAAAGHPGRFADATRLVGLAHSLRVNGRGLAAADYDNDGDLDLAVNSIGGPLLLFRNSGGTGHWLEVQTGAFAPGTQVTVVLPDGRTLVRETRAGASYLSSEDPRVHFGLGAATRVPELRVRYPGGRETVLRDVAADRLLTVRPPR